MSAHCHHHGNESANDPLFRRVLWIALLVNAAMFLLEIIAGRLSDSVALQADALDFLSDATNYAISLFVIDSALNVRARASMFKALCMLVFALLVLSQAVWSIVNGSQPVAVTMGLVGLLALVANAIVAVLLFRYRTGDSNMQSIWLCSRNDAIGNIAVVLAAFGVFGTGTAWPDLLVAMVMAFLALTAAWRVYRLARAELAVPM